MVLLKPNQNPAMSKRNNQLDTILDHDEVIFVIVNTTTNQPSSEVRTPIKPKMCSSVPVVQCMNHNYVLLQAHIKFVPYSGKQPNILQNKNESKKKVCNKSYCSIAD